MSTDTDVKNIKSLMADYMADFNKKAKKVKAKPVRDLQPFQIWALQFSERFGCEKKELGVLMRVGKQHEDSLDYLRYIEGWLDDYPTRRPGSVVPLFLWKIKQNRLDREIPKSKD